MKNWGSYKSASMRNFSIEIDEKLDEELFEICVSTKNWYLRYSFHKLDHFKKMMDFFDDSTQEKFKVKTENQYLCILRDNTKIVFS